MERRTGLSWMMCVTLMAGGGLSAGAKAQTANRAPKISGSPAPTVLQQTKYLFKPVATDADRDRLTFKIKSKPGWASFNKTTGRLSGTPSPADVGNYSNIRISVTDGRATASLPAFGIAVTQSASGSVTVAWTPPTRNADGSPISDLAGYRIYMGRSSNALTSVVALNNAGLSRYVVENLSPTRWYFALTSVNRRGRESARTPTLSKVVG
ncbi:MAG: putative Ig domain-containing protein [Steroidobacteraceae bacterium]